MKKGIAFVLVLAMLLASTNMLFAAELKTKKEAYNYVSIGASQTCGYGLPGYANKTDYAGGFSELNGLNEFHLVEGCFSDLVLKYLQKENPKKDVKVEQLTFGMCRSNDILPFLYDDYKIDFYSNFCFLGDQNTILTDFANVSKQTTSDALTSLKAIYKKALKEADFITYDLGCANFSLGLTYCEVPDDFESLFTADEYKMFIQFRENVNTQVTALLKQFDIDAKDVEPLATWLDAMTYSLVGYCSSLDKTMSWIYKNNENVDDLTVVVMQVQNYLSGLEVEMDGVVIPIGEISNILIGLANNYAATYSKYSSKYIYVRTTEDPSVSRILEDFMAYETGDDLSQFKTILEDYEFSVNTVSVKALFEKVCTGQYAKAKASQEALNLAYDTYIKFIQNIINDDSVTAKTYNAWDPSTVGYKALNQTFGAIVKNLIREAVAGCCANSYDMTNALSNAATQLAKDEEAYAYAKYYIEFSLGGTALLHPSKDGYEEIFEAFKETIESNDTVISRKLDGVKYAVNDVLSTTNRIVKFAVNQTQKKIEKHITKQLETVEARLDEKLNGLVSELIPKIFELIK